MFVPVGGGGLIAGIAAVLKATDPDIRVVGCQPSASDAMRRSVEAGRVVEVEWRPTLSTSTVGGLEPGTITLDPCSRFVDGEIGMWVPLCSPLPDCALLCTLRLGDRCGGGDSARSNRDCHAQRHAG